MRPLRLALPALLAATLLGAVEARAATLHWLGSKLPTGPSARWGYFIDGTRPTPGGIPLATVVSETQASYQRWEDVNCAYISFASQGQVAAVGDLGRHDDTKSVMATFVEDRNDARYAEELGNGVAVGVALTYKVDGVIQGCDTTFNAASWRFSTTGAADAMDLASLFNHENGHCLGLDHVPEDTTSVLYPNVVNGELRRALSAHDIDNVCQLYPETGALGSPCSGSSCGGGLTCIDDPVQGGRFCSQPCSATDPSACAAGFGCRASTAIPSATAACFPGAGDRSPVIGRACTDAAACRAANAVCLTEAQGYPGGSCSESCGDGTCARDAVCVSFSTGSLCMGACSATGAGGSCRDGYACNAYDAAGNGFCFPACSRDADCGTGRCLCTGVCAPVGNPLSSIGSACRFNSDCSTGAFCIPATINGAGTGWASGYCASPCGGGQSCLLCPGGSTCVVSGAEGQSYCLATCSDQLPCRDGYACIARGNTSVCMPGCTKDEECAVGLQCSRGACIRPGSDGGGQPCVLCTSGGSVGGATGGGSSGSTGGDTGPAAPGGCGCTQASGAEAVLTLCGALLALGARARRQDRW